MRSEHLSCARACRRQALGTGSAKPSSFHVVHIAGERPMKHVLPLTAAAAALPFALASPGEYRSRTGSRPRVRDSSSATLYRASQCPRLPSTARQAFCRSRPALPIPFPPTAASGTWSGSAGGTVSLGASQTGPDPERHANHRPTDVTLFAICVEMVSQSRNRGAMQPNPCPSRGQASDVPSFVSSRSTKPARC